jgi:hypothetical protein
VCFGEAEPFGSSTIDLEHDPMGFTISLKPCGVKPISKLQDLFLMFLERQFTIVPVAGSRKSLIDNVPCRFTA